MREQAEGPGWWQASDGKWYPPDQSPAPGWWQASDGKWYPPDQAPAAGGGRPLTVGGIRRTLPPSVQMQQAQQALQARQMAEVARTARMARGMMTGWAVGVLLALVLSTAFAWWVVSGVDFSNGR